jgi:glycosyltransferase involved in cell wall biosynthesis
MLYGCIPFGSNVFGIPELIGDNGFILYKKDIQLAMDLIEKAVSLPTGKLQTLSTKASSSIENRYSLKRRQNSFINIINNL